MPPSCNSLTSSEGRINFPVLSYIYIEVKIWQNGRDKSSGTKSGEAANIWPKIITNADGISRVVLLFLSRVCGNLFGQPPFFSSQEQSWRKKSSTQLLCGTFCAGMDLCDALHGGCGDNSLFPLQTVIYSPHPWRGLFASVASLCISFSRIRSLRATRKNGRFAASGSSSRFRFCSV